MTRAATSRTHPRAHATCDRCGFRYNHDELQWQFQWAGPKLQNLRLLVCQSCLDVPQEQLRTIVLPPDPVPIQNPRPENYENANNPNSPIGQAPISALAGTNIGSLIQGGGTYSAFDGNANKPLKYSAMLLVCSNTGFDWIGKDWAGGTPGATISSSNPLALIATGFTITAPNDSSFLGSSLTTQFDFQGSSDAVNWTQIYGPVNTTGAHGEVISVTGLTGNAYRYHRFTMQNNLADSVGIAQVAIDTNRGYTVS